MSPRLLFFSILIVIAIGDVIILSAEPENKIIYANWVLLINSSAAAIIAFYIVYKEKKFRSDKTNFFLTVGLLLWFAANVVWAYYEVVLDVVSPVPSLADIFLLSAYGFLIYRLVVVYKNLKEKVNKKTLFILGAITTVFLAYMFSLTLDLSNFSTSKGTIFFIITFLYPLLNSILAFLAVLILIGIRHEKIHYITWLCELLALLSLVLGDSWFAIIVLTELVEQLWVSSLLLSAHYVIIAGGLIWYIKYLVPIKIPFIMNKQKTFFSRQNKMKIAVFFPLFILTISISFVIIYGLVEYNEDLLTKNIIPTPVGGAGIKTEIIGAILPKSGSFASTGIPTITALNIAEQDVNEFFQKTNSSMRVKLQIEDSKTNPSETLNAIKRLHKANAKVIVGPMTSAAVNAVINYTNENDMVLISQSSTSPALSVVGDNLFRFIPDDKNQGKYMAKKMWDSGIKIVVPMWRDDIYGNELYKSMKENFENLGGIVSEGVKYKPHIGKFAASLHRINFIMWNQDLKQLSQLVENQTKKVGNDYVGVYLISYDEVTPIMIQANEHKILDKVRWFGADSTAQNNHLLRNKDSALFAIKTNFVNPLFTVSLQNEKIEHIVEEIEKGKHEPTLLTYPIISYDALWVAALSLDKSNTMIEKFNINTLKENMVKLTESYRGISGNITLNNAGDRINGQYELWKIA
ncbi:MAG TPA: ABC transporter substrate-binding protein, partial [Nitrososphaeraceae archaeon]|nr:ABC transporter substrate-binding protein [Nitrososphaeraceae archaeon]